MGLGYVGLPLAVEFARAGLATVGFDIDAERTAAIARGDSYVADVKSDDLSSVVEGLTLSATTDFTELAGVDTINICVPTPASQDPGSRPVACRRRSGSGGGAPARKGQLVVLESTTYPGTVDEVVRPRLEAGGLRAGKDFCLAFSPERIDPGNREWTTRNIPRVVGGVDDRSTAGGHGPLSAHRGDGRPGLVAARGGDGQAAREHVPRRQHRNGERASADVPRPGRRRVGSDRRRWHEAVRLHAVLSGARPGRPLYSR